MTDSIPRGEVARIEPSDWWHWRYSWVLECKTDLQQWLPMISGGEVVEDE